MGIREAYAKAGGWIKKIGDLISGKKEIDPHLLEQLREVLFLSDVGVSTTEKLLIPFQNALTGRGTGTPSVLLGLLRNMIVEILSHPGADLNISAFSPFVMMVIGVNGTGKTTTIGKLGHRYVKEGKKVLLAAADTFRAAASEQLIIWGERIGSQVIHQRPGADPAAVAFDAVFAARARGIDLLMIDTAGRLHTKTHLMEELKKVKKVIMREIPGSPHEVLLVLDATIGQNALSQARLFHQALGVSGIALTKLDGTAKGGILLAIADELKIPVRFVGVGEGIDDLIDFDPVEFVNHLFSGVGLPNADL